MSGGSGPTRHERVSTTLLTSLMSRFEVTLRVSESRRKEVMGSG